jgi:thiamine biosynthesis lipoprotein
VQDGRRIGQLRLNDRALGTSGSGTQFFVHQGRRFGHLIDPRTGQPAEGVLSVSAVAPTAAQADALATALYVMGPADARDFCATHREIGCVMLCPGPAESSAHVHAFGLDERHWHELEWS